MVRGARSASPASPRTSGARAPCASASTTCAAPGSASSPRPTMSAGASSATSTTVLSDRGLGPALQALATRCPVPVEISSVPEAPLGQAVEAAAYFVAAEALTNVAKYAQASEASVALSVERDRLCVQIRDDGVGGANPSTGSGLRGLRDRVDALDGQLEVHSPPGEGTTVAVEIPVQRDG